jgi:O-acetylhomoserine/O-acetylserine sulfhydrylase-like pyridoxal-dependent enzyme
MISAEQRAQMGVTEQMVRLSVGIEALEDQIEDLERALQAVSSRVGVPVGSSSRS